MKSWLVAVDAFFPLLTHFCVVATGFGGALVVAGAFVGGLVVGAGALVAGAGALVAGAHLGSFEPGPQGSGGR